MEKVGILTLTGESNYGNKLQNYALEQVLINLGFEVETIRVASKAENNNPYWEICVKTYIQHLGRFFLKDKRRTRAERRYKFLKFNGYLHQASFTVDETMEKDKIKDKLQQYNYLVYGSDQIWNPQFSTFSKVYLGVYGEYKKNIALSASFGIDCIDDKYIDVFQKNLMNFKAISVREYAGKNIIDNLKIKKDVDVLVDPTLVLEKNSWEKIEASIKLPESYVAKYFLGNSSTEEDNKVNEIASNYCATVMDIGRGKCLGPSEFISYIHKAKCVCTDSYHAVVFSLIFGKEICVFQRSDKYDSMDSRMNTLYKKMGCYGKKEKLFTYFSSSEVTSKAVQENIAYERKRFKDFVITNMK